MCETLFAQSRHIHSRNNSVLNKYLPRTMMKNVAQIAFGAYGLNYFVLVENNLISRKIFCWIFWHVCQSTSLF